MSVSYRWVGPLLEFEVPGSPHFHTERDELSCTLNYEGPYDVLFANQPSWGMTIAGIPSIFTVATVDCSLEQANVGKLTIVLKSCVGNSNPRYRRGRLEVTKRIETHPRYVAEAGEPGAVYMLDDEHMYWLSQAVADESSQAPYSTDPVWGAFNIQYPNTPARSVYLNLVLANTGLVELWNKIKRGEDSYCISIPYVEERKLHLTDPGAQPIDIVQAPPSASHYPTGYIWILKADDAAQESSSPVWTRYRKWLGFDWIDQDLYA